jgi:hypothetical protein
MTRTFKSHTASASQRNLTRALTLLMKVTARSLSKGVSGNLLWQVLWNGGLTARGLPNGCTYMPGNINGKPWPEVFLKLWPRTFAAWDRTSRLKN